MINICIGVNKSIRLGKNTWNFFQHLVLVHVLNNDQRLGFIRPPWEQTKSTLCTNLFASAYAMSPAPPLPQFYVISTHVYRYYERVI